MSLARSIASLLSGGGSVLLNANNLSDVANAATARTNLGAVNKAGDTMTGQLQITSAGFPLLLQNNATTGDTSTRIALNTNTAAGGPGGAWYPTANTDGTFAVHQGGVGDRLTIDASGRVKKPYQPAFFAYHSGQGNWTTEQDLSCDVADLNVGGHYSTSTFRFTAPIAGTYFIEFHAMNNQNNPGASFCALKKNGVNYHYFHIVNNHPSSVSSSVIISLAAGDYISFSASNLHYNGGSANKYPKICGYLLG